MINFPVSDGKEPATDSLGKEDSRYSQQNVQKTWGGDELAGTNLAGEQYGMRLEVGREPDHLGLCMTEYGACIKF